MRACAAAARWGCTASPASTGCANGAALRSGGATGEKSLQKQLAAGKVVRELLDEVGGLELHLGM